MISSSYIILSVANVNQATWNHQNQGPMLVTWWARDQAKRAVSDLMRAGFTPSALPHPMPPHWVGNPTTTREKQNGPKDVLSPIPEACEYVTFEGKRDLADVIKVTDLKIERWTWIIEFRSRELSPTGGRRDGAEGEERDSKDEKHLLNWCCFKEGGGRVMWNTRGLQELGEALSQQPERKQDLSPTAIRNWILQTIWISLSADSPQEPPDRAQATNTLILALSDPDQRNQLSPSRLLPNRRW